MRSWSTVASGSLAIQEVLPPEQNADPSPVTTTARRSRSAASSATAETHDEVISSDMALRMSGLSRVSSGHAVGRPLDAQVGMGGHERTLLTGLQGPP